ncbi:leucyl aminopeptidase [Sphingomonas sp. BIUV-7]|uniref:Probable cytosol aminopeptidase n=1 Tax=Sphingomonas natans TaxID=3063330 RepID=A0ABT8YG24_9SPHN|nr:leucyl aminopeptidase [Sphingomonas sp. BIUV-7]MDO6416923.1 leucyl aminopeptidase [Sphingomonas sp. BIUV-7]
MTVSFAAARPAEPHVLVIPVASGEGLEARLPAELSGAGPVAKAAATAARFEGKAGTIVEFYAAEGDAVRRVLLVGLAGSADGESAGGAVVARLLVSGETRVAIDLTGLPSADRPAIAAGIAEGAMLRSWRYDIYRTKLPAKQRPSLDKLVLVVGDAIEAAQAAAAPRIAVAEGVAFTRALVAEPANIIYPESFVERARALADLGVEIEVLGEDEMRAAGMGSLLGVSQGSPREAQLLVMRWDGTGGAVATPTVFVGKGVTFDTGGISLKQPGGMEDMKWDMGGAGAVVGAMKAIAGRKAKAHVVGVCALVENMPDGLAQRPGDIVTSMSGQTIEVINTDAEGRLVLCDAITWVQKRYSPKTIVDLATLTGAMIVSLGHEYGGIFANDDALADALTGAGKATGEKLWRMPMGDAYDKMIDSPIADMKNVGPREAGSISAAQFLLRFVDEGVHWAHLDIAGMVWASKPGTLYDKGATGYGVRLLDRFVSETLES